MLAVASRTLSLEFAIVCVCQGARARVGCTVSLSAMNIDVMVHDAPFTPPPAAH